MIPIPRATKHGPGRAGGAGTSLPGPAFAPDLDLSIPIVDGWECTRRIKADEATRAIPIIALTAHAMRGDEDRARAAGCDGYLTKPISPKRVVEEVKRVLKLS